MAAWLIIGVAMILIAGPIFWAMPTRRDRERKRLRDEARAQNLTVQMRQIPHPDPSPDARVSAGGVPREPRLEVAAYTWPLKLPAAIEPRHVPSWRVLYAASGRGSDAQMLPAGWRFDRAGLPLTQSNLDRLGALLERTPAGTVGVECDSQACALYWRERDAGGAVAAIRDLLEALAALQEQLARQSLAEADVD